MTLDEGGRQFEEYAERQAEAFRARYSVCEAIGWTDLQLDAALIENGYPKLALLPDEPRGMMVGMGHPDDRPGWWRRTNASHLLAHAMIHGGGRCGGCADWGT